jgi:sec-independent protein translocase protein TatA
MGSFSIWHWLIVLVVVVVLFGGRGKLSSIMGDAAKGIRAFQKGLKGDDDRGDDSRPGTLPRTDAEKEDLRR